MQLGGGQTTGVISSVGSIDQWNSIRAREGISHSFDTSKYDGTPVHFQKDEAQNEQVFSHSLPHSLVKPSRRDEQELVS